MGSGQNESLPPAVLLPLRRVLSLIYSIANDVDRLCDMCSIDKLVTAEQVHSCMYGAIVLHASLSQRMGCTIIGSLIQSFIHAWCSGTGSDTGSGSRSVNHPNGHLLPSHQSMDGERAQDQDAACICDVSDALCIVTVGPSNRCHRQCHCH